jgi:di/tripeptidase
MYSLAELERKKIEYELPKYIIEKIDDFTKKYNVNAVDIVTESIQNYIDNQEVEEFYKSFDSACKELKEVLDNPKQLNTLKTLEELIDELED